MGADSIMLTEVNKRIEDIYPGKITVAKIFAYPSIAKLARYLSGGEEENHLNAVWRLENPVSTDIAIVGMSFRLPMAEDKEAFWNNLRNGADCNKSYFLRQEKRYG